MKKICRSTVGFVVLAILAGLPAIASAQAARSGNTFAIGGVPLTTFPDVAYDSGRDRYLVVSESVGHTVIEGQIVNSAGTRLSAFAIAAAPAAGAVQMPRAVFSPDVNGGAGGYLVAWHETPTNGNFTQVKARVIGADGTALTATFVASTEAVSKFSSSSWIMAPAVAYSSGSREFLVTWMGSYGVTNEVRFMRMGLTGTLLQAPTAITVGTADWERDPSVAYNPDDDEFFITYAGYWDSRGYSYVAGRRIKAGTGAVIGTPIEYTQTVTTYVPSVTYNLGARRYLVSWYHRTRSVAAIYGIHVNRDGSAGGALSILSSRYFAYDANDVKYNPVSGDYLVVTHGNNPQPWEDAAVSIKPDGTPYDNGFIVTQTTDVRPLRPNPHDRDGNFYPRIAASTASAKWLLVTSSLFASIHGQFVTSSNTSAPTGPAPTPTPEPTPTPAPAPAPTPPPPPPPPVPAPLMHIDSPGNATSVSSAGFQVAGWAIDRGAPSGGGVDAIHVYAWPVGGGNPTFLGAATHGIARPDLGAHFGAAFTASGFSLVATGLAPGSYDIAVYARSTVSGNFDGRLARVTVTAPVTIPRMWIDLPAQNQDTSQNLSIAGWAVDLGSSTSSGVDAIHIYAYPASGAAPIWLGAATYGTARPDVGGAFGASRFGPSGFRLDTTLAPGAYTLVVFAHSSVTGTFNNAQTVAVTVR